MSGHEDEHANDLDLLAAEYALGVLEPAEARTVEAMSFDDPVLANSIAAWEDRLAPLAGLVGPVQPPAVLWRRLALAAGIEPTVQPSPRRASRAWRSAGLWRATTAGAMAIAASLAFLLYTTPASQAPLVATLLPSGLQAATFLVRVAPDGTATVTATGDLTVPQGRSLELWALRAGSTTPVSLGLLPAQGRGRLLVQQPADTQLLVSQEPSGGSPTRLPTGPVVYAGRLTGI